MAVLVLFTALDLVAGRDQQMLGLVVIAPLVGGSELDDDVAFLAVRLPCPSPTANEPQPASAGTSPQR